jgi:hypothetical protein
MSRLPWNNQEGNFMFRTTTITSRFANQLHQISQAITQLAAPVAFDSTDPVESGCPNQVLFRNRVNRPDIKSAAGNDPHLSGAETTAWPPLRTR